MDSACWILYFLITLTAISQSKAITWFEAQTKCRERNQSLTLWRNKSTSFFWTGYYKKRSHWIKIIGCYNSSGIQTTENKEIYLSISSPPLCQEHCLQKNYSLFAVQNNTCICLSDGFDSSRDQLASSYCPYTCTSSGLLSTECGGTSAFNVFLTDTTNVNVDSKCLSLQCVADSKFLDNACTNPLIPICSSLAYSTTYTTWRKTKEYCKGKENYPIGNLTLSNITMACTESNHNNTSPGWIGVVREVIKMKDKGQLISKSDQVFVKRCLKCLLNESTQKRQCKYDVCDVHLTNTIYCSKDELTTPQQENTETSYLETTTNIFSTSLYETTSVVSIDSDKIESKGGAIIIVPVGVVILLLSVFSVAIVLYIRRKKQLQEKNAVEGRSPHTNGSKNYPNVENQTEKNYFVLQKSNPSYELAGECIVGSESPYNEAEDGTYDHLGNKDARKAPAEDIYNHTSSAELSDLSDYDVANHKHLNEEDSTYDHAGVGDSSYGHFDLHPIKETDYSMLS